MINKNDCNERNNARKQIRDAIFFNGDSIDFTKVSIEDTVNSIEGFIFNKNDLGNDSKQYRNIVRETIMKIKKNENLNYKKQLFNEKINTKEYLDKINEENKNLKVKDKVNNNRKILNPPKLNRHNKNNSYSGNNNDFVNNYLKKSFDRYDEEIDNTMIKPEIIEKLNESIQNINKKKKDNSLNNSINKEGKSLILNDNIDVSLQASKNNNFIMKNNEDKIFITNNNINDNISINNNNIENIFSINSKIEDFRKNSESFNNNYCKPKIDIPNNKKEIKRNRSFNNIKNNKDILEMQIKQTELESQCKLYKKEIFELKERIKQLQNEKLELSSNNQKLQIENSFLQEKIDRISKENINLKKINNENTKNYSQLKENIELKTINLDVKLTNFLEDIKTSNFDKLEKKNGINILKKNKNNKNDIYKDNLKINEETKNSFNKLYDEKNPFIDSSCSFSSFINSTVKKE